ncbi:MAG TPA: efflux RND transporter periplasmic adaptor subunit [Thermoanaerobaculia bacterium]|nr:efflux RND transporter periplasmic adaptor subunit [Thermoanaerobaculia bacterium]
MKRILIIVAGLLVLGGVLAASMKAGSAKKGVRVYAEAAARRDIQQVVKATGEINPRIKVNISAHVVAKIEKLFVDEGAWIEKGQPFLRLEQNVFVADRDQWAAQLRSAETAVRRQEVALADTASKLHRAQLLYNGGSFTAEQLENAQLAERSARLQLDEAKDLVSQDRANLLRAQTDLGKTVIYAPISGQVIALSAKEGEVVVSGTMNNAASVIGTIADMSEVLAEVDVDETEIVQVQPGQRAELKVDALPKRVYHGKVTEVGSSGYNRPSQPDVTFFKVKVLLDDSDHLLRSGMSVRAEIETQADKGALVVPIQAVVERPPLGASGGNEVKVVFVVAGGKAHQRKVDTGISNETRVEVLTGLRPGEQVVTGPYRSLRDLKDGDPVRIGTPSPGGGAAGGAGNDGAAGDDRGGADGGRDSGGRGDR